MAETYDSNTGTRSLDVGNSSSPYNANQDLVIGNTGLGDATVHNGATLKIGTGYSLILAQQAGSLGVLNIGSLPGATAVSGGWINAARIVGGAGSAMINFNHTGLSSGGSTNPVEIGGIISGNVAVYNYNGRTQFNDSSTYSGQTTLYGGSLALSGLGAITQSSGVSIATGAALDISGVVTSGASITTLGDTTAGQAGSVILGNKTLALTNASTSFGGGISGNGGLTLMGGIQTLTGVNAYRGGTTVAGGTLALSGAGSIATSSGVLLANGSTFDISGTFGSTATIAALTDTGAGQAGAVGLGTKTLTLANASGSFGGAISGDGGLTLAGGNQTLTGISSYKGGTTIAGGTLALSGSGSISRSSGVILATGGTFDISGISSGSLAISSLTDTGIGQAGTVSLGSKTLTLSNAHGSFGGSITGSGGLTLLSGIQTVTGINAYTGGTTITGGTLVLSGAGSIASSSGLVLATGGGFDISGVSGNTATMTSLADTGLGQAGSVSLGNKTLTLSQATGSFGGSISGNGGLTLAAGSQTLTGISSFKGGTTVVNGTLSLSLTGAIANSTVLLASGSALDISNASGVGTSVAGLANTGIGQAGSVNLGSRTLTLANANSTFAGVVSGAGGLGLTAGTQTLTGANTYRGATTVAGGTLALSGAGSIASSSGIALATGGTFDGSGVDGSSVTVTSLTDTETGQTGAVKLGAKTLTLSNAAGSYGGSITGTGGLTLMGGQEILTGASTYTGGTTVAAGSLALSGAGSIVTSSGVLLANGSTFDISGVFGNTATIAALTDTGTGQAGAVNLGIKTLTLANATGSYGGTMSGDGGLTLTGGNQTLTGSTTFKGGTTIAAGTLSLAGAGSIARSSGVILGPGSTFDISRVGVPTATVASLSDTGIGQVGTVILGSKTLTLSNANSSYGGSIGGNGGLTLSAGRQTLAGVNTYTGGTTVTGGTLALAGAGSIASSSSVVLGTGGALDISGVDGSTATMRSLSDTGLGQAGSVYLGNKTLTLSQATGSFGGSISGNGGLTLAAGNQTLTGVSSFRGDTTVANGTLSLSLMGSIPNSTVILASGSTLDISNASGAGASVGGLADTGIGQAGSVNLGSRTLTLANANGSFAGVVSGSGGLTLTGGNQALTGVHTYTGGTAITGGTLSLSGSGSIGASSGVVLATGGTLDISRIAAPTTTIASLSDSGFGQAGAVALGNKTLTLSNAHGSFGGTISGSGGVTLSGGMQILSGVHAYTGATTIAGGTLALAGAGSIASSSGVSLATGATFDISGVTGGAATIAALSDTGSGQAGSVSLGGNTLVLSNATGSFGGSISGAGGVTLAGGTQTLTGAHTYTGGTTITGGTLALSGSGSIAASSGVALGNGGALNIASATGRGTAVAGLYDAGTGQAGSVQLGANTLTLSKAGGSFGGTISGDGGLTLAGGDQTLTGANTYKGNTSINAGTLHVSGDSSLGDGGSAIVFGGGSLSTNASFATGRSIVLGSGGGTLAPSAQTALIAGGVISGSGPLNVSGGGALVLTGANTYTGTTNVTAGSILQIGNGGSTGSIENSASIANNGTLAFNRSDIQTISQDISGSGSVDHLGSGTTIYKGKNTYTGATTIRNGTLQVDGLLSASDVTVLRGGTLAGSGKIGDPLISAGGTLAPGSASSIGTLSIFGPLTFADGSFYKVKITPTDNDRTVVNGTVTIQGGTVQVLAGSGTYTPDLHYTLLTATGGITGKFTSLQTTTNLAFLKPSLAYDNNSLSLGFTQTAPISSIATNRNQAAQGAALNGAGPIVTTTSTPDAGPLRSSVSVAADGTTTTTISEGNSTTVVVATPAAQVATAVLNQTTTGAVQALNALSGEVHAAGDTVAATAATSISNAILDHMRFNSGGAFTDDGDLDEDPYDPDDDDDDYRPVRVPRARTSYALWGQVFGSYGSNDATKNTSRLTQQATGFVMGAETKARVLDDWQIGFAGGYTSASFEVQQRQSLGEFESKFLSVYAHGTLGPLQVRLGGAYAINGQSTQRAVTFPGFHQSLRGKTAGETLEGFAEVGYRFSAGRGYLEPYAGLAAIHIDRDGYKEAGGSAALAVLKQSSDLMLGTTGVQGEVTVADAFAGGGPVVIRGMVGYRLTLGDVEPSSLVAFGGGRPFRAFGAPMERNTMVASVGVNWKVGRRTTFGLWYTGQMGLRTRDHAIKGVFVHRW